MQTYSDADFADAPKGGEIFHDSDFRDAPSDTSASTMSVPASEGYAGDNGGLVNAAPAKALLTNEPVGFGLGLVRSIPSVIGGAIGGPAVAALGESLRQAAVAGASTQGLTAPPTPLQAIIQPILAAGGQYVGDVSVPYIENAIAGGANAAGRGLANVAEYAGVNLAGVKQASYDVAKKLGGATVAKFVGAEPEVGDQLAEQARGIIANAVKTGEDAYPQLIDAAKANPAYAGKTFNLDSALSDKATKIADKYGFIGSNRVPASAGASKFWEMADKAASLKDATLDEVYQLQKQLNSEAAVAYGSGNKTLGAAVGDLMQEVKGFLGKQIPEIGQANASYAAAKALEDATGNLNNANDLLGYVRNAYRNKQMTAAKEAIEAAAQKVPGLGEVIDNIHAYNAAKDFGPLVRGIPQTGFGAAALYGAGEAVKSAAGLVTGDPLAQAGAVGLGAAGAAVASPRLSLLALRAGQAAAPAAEAGAKAVAEGGRAATPLFSQALARMAPASIAAFYRSPGAPSNP